MKTITITLLNGEIFSFEFREEDVAVFLEQCLIGKYLISRDKDLFIPLHAVLKIEIT